MKQVSIASLVFGFSLTALASSVAENVSDWNCNILRNAGNLSYCNEPFIDETIIDNAIVDLDKRAIWLENKSFEATKVDAKQDAKNISDEAVETRILQFRLYQEKRNRFLFAEK